MIRKIQNKILLVLLLFPLLWRGAGGEAFAQFTDDFTDGDFTANPVWNGDVSDWTIIGNQLRSNSNTASYRFSLSTASTKVTDAQWEFLVNLQFSTSSTNYADIALVSDMSDVKNAFNGYFVRVGNTSDEVSLYRNDGGTITEIIDGTDGTTNSATIKIKVTRDATNLWALKTDFTGTGNSYGTEGTFMDATYTTGNFFGVVVQQSTASFHLQHFFDDFYVGNIIVDLTPPAINSIDIITQNQIDVYFSESVEQITSETSTNYFVDNGIGNPTTATRDAVDFSVVHLNFATSFTQNILNTLTVNNVQDMSSNPAVNATGTFTFVVIQVVDSFADGDFTNNPTWFGEDSVWTIDNGKLRSNSLMTNNTFYLSTRSTMSLNAQWEFWCNLQFSTSSTNYVDVVLMSNDSVLENNFNGYFVKIGNTADEISLYRKDGGTVVEILDGVDGAVNSSNNFIKIKVKRNAAGDWTLERDMTGSGSSYFTEGTTNDLTYINSKFFGFVVRQSTSSNFQKHFFDDINASPIIIDVTPPAISSLDVISNTQLDIYFSESVEQISSETEANYFVNNGIGSPTSALRDGTNTNLIHLIFTNPFALGVTNTLTVNGVQDASANAISNGTATFFYYVVQKNDIVINEIFADPTPQIGLPDAEFVEIFNRSGFDLPLNGWTFSNGSTNGILPDVTIQKDSFIILCSTANQPLLASFGNAIALSSMPALTNSGDDLSLTDNFGNQIFFVQYDDAWYRDAVKDDGGWSLELIDANKDCFGEANWLSSIDASGGTPGRVNSVLGMNWDTIAPKIASIEILSSNGLRINFTEAIDTTGMNNTAVYLIDNGIGNPSFAFLSADFLSVDLILPVNIDSNTVYTVTISSLKDCIGNTSANLKELFAFPKTPSQNDVVINEIFPDNNPVLYLPPYEFLELFNRSNKILNLNGWTINTGSAAILPPFLLLPDSFVIITASANAGAFSQYGKMIGVSSFGLTDAGETISLNDDLGNLIHQINYSSSWYRDGTKDDGGWSLELINPDNPCFSEANWRASTDTTGGTPGKTNSVLGMNWDTVAPKIANIEILSSNGLRVNFTESIDTTGMSNLLVYFIDNGLGNPSNAFLSADFLSVDLILPINIDSSLVYTLTISFLKDCIGNSLNNTQEKFAIPRQAERYDVLINEIFADPDPTVQLPTEEFAELYNHSSKTIDLSGWKFTDGSTTATLNSFLLLPDSFVIITSSGNYALFSSYGKTIAVSSFPGLNNAGEALTVFDASGKMIHTVNYSDSWYRDALKKDGGWTLEMIDPNSPCEGANNWKSSTDPSGGTPGRKNAVFANNPDVTPPQLMKINVLDSVTLQLFFSETINDALPLNVSDFSIDNGIGNPLTATISSVSFNTVILFLGNKILPKTIYTLIVGGVKDCAGNIIGLDNSGRFGLAEAVEANDIVINEVLFNPKTNCYDFVEIYNRSSKIIDLNEMKLADLTEELDTLDAVYKISGEAQLIFPSEYWVLSYDPDNVKQNYFTPAPKNFIRMSMPSFNDDEGTVLILDANNVQIDFLHYYDDWQFNLIDNIGDYGVSLERIDFDKPTDNQSNWHSAASTIGFATPAYKNSQFNDSQPDDDGLSVEPEVFSPDEDGKDDFLNIHYKTDDNGYLATVKIFDARGRLVRELVKNELLALQGTFTWDGLTDKKEKTRLGIYVVYAEIFKPDNGKVKKYKRGCVVAGKL